MGFNTVAMLLNDHFHEIEKAPLTLTYGLCNPPNSQRELDERRWLSQSMSYAADKGERSPFTGGVNVLPTFHADDLHFLYAGRNHLERLEFFRFGTSRVKDVNRRTVTLYLPDWLDPRRGR